MTQQAPTAPRATPSIGPNMNIVRLVNEGDRPFRMRYGPLEWLHLDAGQETAVIEEVAWHFLGRWWMDNSNPRLRERANEYQRLRTLYGSYESDETWEQNRPRIIAYTMSGERITTVVDDPDGNANQGPTPMSRELNLESQLAHMQGQILKLQAEVDRKVRSDEATAQPAPPVDVRAPGAPMAPGVTAPGPRRRTIGSATLPVAGPAITPAEPASTEESYDDEQAILVDGTVIDAPPRLPVHREVLSVDDDPELLDGPPVDEPSRVPVG